MFHESFKRPTPTYSSESHLQNILPKCGTNMKVHGLCEELVVVVGAEHSSKIG
jgi:hypothetical protein